MNGGPGEKKWLGWGVSHGLGTGGLVASRDLWLPSFFFFSDGDGTQGLYMLGRAVTFSLTS
jgi:hypothetical protein